MKTVNLGIVAHVDAGKTTLTEQLLYHAGVTRSAGSVDDGTAQTDFMEVERERGISVKSSSASLSYNGSRINLIDTPGHVDFAAEVERSLSVLDAAVLVISAVEGIQSHTELLWDALVQTGTRAVLFCNKLDRVGSDFDGLLGKIHRKFTPALLCFTKVLRQGDRECAICSRSLSEPDFAEEASEAIAEWDEAFMERYLSGQPVREVELQALLREQIALGHIVPVLAGSAALGLGCRELLDFAAQYLEPVKNRTDDQLSAVVYKITHDKTMGRIAHVRLFGGSIRNRDSVILHPGGEEQKISQIRRYNGARYTDLGEAGKGDIAALCGLSDAKVSDVIGELSGQLDFRLAVPLFRVQAMPGKPEELHSLLQAFTELSAEDPQLDVQYDPDEREINVNITGMIQLEILSALVRERYGLAVSFLEPTVIYKETPAGFGRGFDAYTMPKPCWAVVALEIEPLPRGAGFQYSAHVPNDKLFYRYQNHIEIAVERAKKQGLYNWEVVDLKVTLVDGEHHTIHTHPMDFFLATPIAFLKALKDSGSTLLEPMQTARILVPEEMSGKVMGDIIAMRGEYDSPVIRDGTFQVEARLPVASSMNYSVRLASQTGGKGVLSTRFCGYQECPPELGRSTKRHGVNPLDRDKWILAMRNALH